MAVDNYGIVDFQYVAAGAAVLGSGGGGSYNDARRVIDELSRSGWGNTVPVRDYDGKTDCCVLAMMGSPDKGDNLALTDISLSISNTLNALIATASPGGHHALPISAIPVEVGPINSIVPLIAAALPSNPIQWVVDGDGAGRAVPELPQTTYSSSAKLTATPCALGNNAEGAKVLSAVLSADSSETLESLAGGVLAKYGSFAGVALWSSNDSNGHALSGSYIPGTLAQAWALGKYLMTAGKKPASAEVASKIGEITKRNAAAVAINFYITSIAQTTSGASLDAGVIRLDNTPDQANSTETHYIYNLNENLIMYSSRINAPGIIAPDSICYYSEDTGLGFSNAKSDLDVYFDSKTGKSTGKKVSIIKVATDPRLYRSPGVVASFAGLLQQIGYAGAMPSN